MRLVGRVRHRGAVPQPRLPDRPTLIGTPGANLSGERPDGTPIEVAVTESTVAILFLTGACYGCRALWEGAGGDGLTTPAPALGEAQLPPGPVPAVPVPALPALPALRALPALPALPLVIVTPSRTTEDARVVASLAPETGMPVVMSSEAWHAYRVARAPWYVGVAGGMVVADGLAPETWSDLLAELARLSTSGATAS